MADTFLGIATTGRYKTDQYPQNWREGILKLFPNGDTPLTIVSTLLAAEDTDDPRINWHERMLSGRGGATAGLYTDAALTNPCAGGEAQFTTLYAQVAEAIAREFREGHGVELRYSGDPTMTVYGKCTLVQKNGASSVLGVKLLEADNNSSYATDLTDCDLIYVRGSVNPEGGATPESIQYLPTKRGNYTHIHWTAMKMSRTAKKTRLRTGDPRVEAKIDTMEQHTHGLEQILLRSVMSWGEGDNAEPEHTTNGIIPTAKTHGVTDVYNLNPAYSGMAWTTSGMDWFNSQLALLARWSSFDYLYTLCGSEAALGIARLAAAHGHINLTPETLAFGIKVRVWNTIFGEIALKIHPLFNFDAADLNSILTFTPRDLKWRPLDDTFWCKDLSEKLGGNAKIDGTVEGAITEGALEYHHPIKLGWWGGAGLDNEV